jgi:hypothetical protein
MLVGVRIKHYIDFGRCLVGVSRQRLDRGVILRGVLEWDFTTDYFGFDRFLFEAAHTSAAF